MNLNLYWSWIWWKNAASYARSSLVNQTVDEKNLKKSAVYNFRIFKVWSLHLLRWLGRSHLGGNIRVTLRPAIFVSRSSYIFFLFGYASLYVDRCSAPSWVAMQACLSSLVANGDCLVQIQRLATRLVKSFRRLPYKERLRRLGLHTLNRCRLCGELITAPSVNSFKCQLDSARELLFSEVPWSQPLPAKRPPTGRIRTRAGVVRWRGS